MEKVTFQILTALLLMNLSSCHAYIDIAGEENYEKYGQKHHTYAISLKTKNDSMVYFSEKYPGRIANGEVFGPRHVLQENFGPDSLLQSSDLQSPTFIKPLKQDQTFRQVSQGDTRLVCNLADTTHVPFSEISQVHVKKIDPGDTLIAITFFSGAYAGLLIWAINHAFSNLNLWE